MQTNETIQPVVLTTDQACQFLNVGLTHFYELRKREDFPCPIPLGTYKANRYLIAELHAWLLKQPRLQIHSNLK